MSHDSKESRGTEESGTEGSEDSKDLAGKPLGEHYVLESLLGQGGMGVVYRATDVRSGEHLAIKLLRQNPSDGLVARFEREVGIMETLDHPNVPSLRAFGSDDDGRPFFVMDLLEGETLAERLQRGRLSEPQWRAVIDQICDGLEAIHEQGIVHRDLKPANVFLTDDELKEGSVKLLDFGIAKLVGGVGQTKTAEMVGTPQYMAPEQARADRSNISERTDIFSLGTIAYEMICGVRPFSGDSAADIVHQILNTTPPSLADRSRCPPSVSVAVDVALSKSPEDRFASISELRAALDGDTQPRARRETDSAATVRARPLAKRATTNAARTARTKRERPAASAAHEAPSTSRSWPIKRLVALVALAAILAVAVTTGRRGPLPIPADLAQAFAKGNAGLEAMVDGDHGLAAQLLAAAYASGDRRLGVRVALRRELKAAEAFVGSFSIDDEPRAAAISSDEIAIASATSLRRSRRDGSAIDEHVGVFRHLSYSPDGRYLLASDGAAILIARESGSVSSFEAGTSLRWLDSGELVVFRPRSGQAPASLSTRAPAAPTSSIAERTCPEGEATFQHAGRYTGLRCGDRLTVYAGPTLERTRTFTLAPDIEVAWLTLDGTVVASSQEWTTTYSSATGKANRLSGKTTRLVLGRDSRTIALADDVSFSLHRTDYKLGLPTVRLWSHEQVSAARFLASGHFLRGSNNGSLTVHDSGGGFELLTIAAHDEPILHLSSHENTVLSLTRARASLWDVSPARFQQSPIHIDIASEHRKALVRRTPRLVGENRLLARVGGVVHLIDLETHESIRLGDGARLVVSADGSLFALNNTIYDGRTGAVRASLEDGVIAVIGSNARALGLSDPQQILRLDGSSIETIISEENSSFASVDLSEDGEHYVVYKRTGLRGRASIFRVSDSALVVEYDTAGQRAKFVGESHLAIFNELERTTIWNWRTQATYQLEHRIAFRLNSEMLVSSREGLEQILALEDGTPVGRGDRRCNGWLRGLGRNGLATLECERRSGVWDVKNEIEVVRLDFEKPKSIEMVISSEGHFAIASSARGLLTLDLRPEDRDAATVMSLAARLAPRAAR